MTKPGNMEEQKLDDQIAEFADQALATDEEINMDNTSQTSDIFRMQKTILALKSAVKSAQPDEDVRARTRAKLLLAFEKESPKEKLIPTPRKVTKVVFASGLALLILVGLILPSYYETNTPLTGTAEGSPIWLPFVILAGIAIIVFIVWSNRQR